MQRQGEFASAILIVAVLGFLAQPALAQVQLPQLRPMPAPAQAPAKPYKQVAVTLPAALDDAGFAAFRKQLGDVARRRDRAALATLIVGRGFFWEQDTGDGADKTKSGLANLTKAMGLDLPDNDDSGWDTMSIYAEDPTVAPMAERQGVVCGPADPAFDEQELQKVIEATQTDVNVWIYTVTNNVEVRAAPQADAAAIDKLGLIFVRVLPERAGDPGNAAGEFVRIVTPSGKIGFVPTNAVASLGVSQLCYVKEGGAWKIAGVIGGVEP